jgi:hypothetical protein
VNDRPSSMSYESLGGATSTGEFGTMLAGLFDPQSQAQFKEVRRETFKGRPTVLFEFAVKKSVFHQRHHRQNQRAFRDGGIHGNDLGRS